MSSLLTSLDPQPLDADVPPAFPSPFDELGPHALARRAAESLKAELRAGLIAPGLSTSMLDGAEGGKMFGVLVVRSPDGRLGFLRAFSATLAGRWEVAGYVPPLFEAAARAQFEPAGDASVKALLARSQALETSEELGSARAAHAALASRHAAERTSMRARHEAHRTARQTKRTSLTEPAALHALDQESRADKAEKRRAELAQTEERARLAPVLARLERRGRALERLRRLVCRRLMQRIHDTYVVPNARGQRWPLRELFSGEPPAGAGDCAGPKLLAYALTHGLQPLALAEFWWGAPPRAGGRVAGAFYGSCREKCGPLLPSLLEGLEVAPPRMFRPPTLADASLRIVYEDAQLVVIDKPCGLLSVPGRNASVTDSVIARLRARYPQPLLAHRLDLDTSGLLVAALDPGTHAALQRQFARREVRKSYVALLAGDVVGEHGTIDFPMRVDLHDRPRQIHDPVHGKSAVTGWSVLARAPGRTRVALFPLTGRTHQLRVHAAHPLGLGAAIVGDRLYGQEDARLMLHAEWLAFMHPKTGQVVTFESLAPF